MLEKCPQCQRPYPPGQRSCPQDHTELDRDDSQGAADRLVNTLLDNRYRIEKLLGAGGMGKVYAGIHLVTGKRYAIKMLHPQLIDDENARRRFEREAKAVTAIEHPHIVELYDYGKTPGGAPFLVMEYMQGSTLRSYFGTLADRPMPLDLGVLFALQMAQALQHVHECGIVHRDVKPDNIQLDVDSSQNMVAKLFDFGIARIQSQEAVTEASSSPPRTLAYAAPEMHLRRDYLSPAIDVYALGVTLFEMLTNQRPFSGRGVEVVLAHMNDPPPRPSELRQDVRIPAALDLLVGQMLAKAPDKRPKMAEVADSLSSVLTQLPSTSARGLHHLRTYVLPKRLPQRPQLTSPSGQVGGAAVGAASAMSAASAMPMAPDGRSLSQIETARQQAGAKIERETRSIINRLFKPDVPGELAELLRCCSELEEAKSEVELDLALMQDTHAQEKAAAQAARQALRQRLHSVRDELRAVPTAVFGMTRLGPDIAKELAELELAYSAPVPPSPLAEQIVQKQTQRQRLSVELVDVQRDLSDRLLQATQGIAEEARKKPGGRVDPNLSMYVKRLTVVVSELDALDEALAVCLEPSISVQGA